MTSLFQKLTLSMCILFCASLCIDTATAQKPAGSTQAMKSSADDEEILDDKIREFGYWSGAAYGCVPAAKQPEIERKVLDTFNHISRLFGTDRAFFYAAAFGNGTTMKIEAQKCPEFLSKFEKATALRGGKAR